MSDETTAPAQCHELPLHDAPRWHRVAVETDEPGSRTTRRQSTEGGDAVTAAWLRAVADEIDPPKPTRPTLREDGGGRRGPIIGERRVPGAVAAMPTPPDVRDPMSLR